MVSGDVPHLTTEERILLVLSEVPEEEIGTFAPLESTIDGLGERLGILPNNISRVTARMEKVGLIKSGLARVEGAQRRRKVLLLTDRGSSRAREVINRLRTAVVKTRHRGVVSTTSMEEVARRLGGGLVGYLTAWEEVKRSGIVDLERERDEISSGIGKHIIWPEALTLPTQFLGRDDDLDHLLSAMGDRQVKLAAVTGIAGIGKSTLVAQGLQEGSIGRHVFWHACKNWDTAQSLAGELGEFLNELGRPELKNSLNRGLDRPREWVPTFLTCARGTGMVLFLDDSHKCPGIVSSLLPRLFAGVDGKSVKLVVAGREKLDFYTRRDVLVDRTVVEINLNPLDPHFSREFFSGSLKEKEFDKLYSITGGVPLFLELADNADIHGDTTDIWLLVEEEVFKNLKDRERSILETLSVYAEPVPLDVLDMVGDDPFTTVNSLAKRHWVSITAGDRITIHDALREFTYRRLLPPKKKKLHRSAARYYLERKEDDIWDRIKAVYHLQESGNHSMASRIITDNADELLRGDPKALLAMLDGIREEGLKPQRLLSHLTLKGETLMSLQRWEEAHDVLSRAVKAVRKEGGQSSLEAHLLSRLGHVRMEVESWAGTKRAQQEALRLYRESNDLRGMARTRVEMGLAQRKRGRMNACLEQYRRALNIFKKLKDRDGMLLVLVNRAQAHLSAGHPRQARNDLERAMGLGREGQSTRERGVALWTMGTIFSQQGDYRSAISNLRQAQETLEKSGDLTDTINVMGDMADIHLKNGDTSKALDTYRKCIRLIDERKKNSDRGIFHAFRSASASTLDPMDDQAIEILVSMGDIHRDEKDLPNALKSVKEAIRRLEGMNDPARMARLLFQLGSHQEDMGKPQDAIKSWNSARILLKDLPGPDRLGQVAVDLNLARVKEGGQDLQGALELLKEAGEVARALGERRGEAVALERMGRILMKTRENLRGKKALRRAGSLYASLGDRDGVARTKN